MKSRLETKQRFLKKVFHGNSLNIGGTLQRIF